jgi:OPA family sugar phosphate sensor protein UhpC-like MFS transporter
VLQYDDGSALRAQSGRRATVFGLTWIAYASYYFGRMGFPVVKSTLQKTMGLSVDMLGWIDTGYLTAYAIGQFGSGFLGDRIGPRRLLGLGMLGGAGACVLFGLNSAAAVLLLAYVLNGFFQSTGWPGTCKAMGSWLTPSERGTIMGIWSTCYQIGPIAATWTATFLFAHWGWRWAFLGPAVLIATVGVLNLLFLPERRAEAPPASGPDAADPALEAADPEFSVLRSPVLWSLGGAYFCLKLIRYSIFFWLPYYLSEALGYAADVAGYRSVSFTVGGVAGSVVVGLISDRYFPGRRRIISSIMCAALAVSLLLYTKLAPVSMTLNFGSMALIGFCLFGPDTIICGAAAQDIGGRHNVAKAAGFVNGVGSIGAIFQGIVTSSVSQSRFGWNGLFYIFAALALLSSAALLIGKRKD